ncbi:MAG: ribosome small subunit-dependent GTPase A [bacterium]
MRSNSRWEGLVLRVAGNWAKVLVGNEEIMVAIPGRWRLGTNPIWGKRGDKSSPFPKVGGNPLAPGDRVVLIQERGIYHIEELLPRKNHFTRRAAGSKPIPQTIAANLDLAVIIAAFHQPSTPPGLIDRLLVTASAGGVPAILLVNKTDLARPDDLSYWRDLYRAALPTILFTSALTGEGLEELKELIQGKMVLLAGASGVGKSTIANRLHPGLNLRTQEVSPATGKGRHTTSAAQLHPMPNGGWITDTPGQRECSPWGIAPQELAHHFPEIRHLSQFCPYRNCLHQQEENCAVIAAAGTDELPSERYYSYRKLLSELQNEKYLSSLRP